MADMSKIRIGDKALVQLLVSQPVSKVRLRPYVGPVAFPLLSTMLHPPLHALVILLQYLLVSSHTVYVIRHDDAGISPGTAAISPHVGEGSRAWVGSVFSLSVPKVAHPLAVEILHVGIIQCSDGENLGVASPSQPFVTLGAVGGNTQEIAALAPPYILVQTVDVGIGTLEPAPLLDVASDYLSFEMLDLHVAGGRQLCITESEKCVARMVGLFTTAFHHISQRSVSRT